MLRHILFTGYVILMSITPGSAYSVESATNTKNSTTANFSVDSSQKPMQSVIALVEDHPIYSNTHQWLTMNFYAFTPNKDELIQATKGDIKPIEKRVSESDNYNDSNAKLILSIEKATKQVTQVDLAVPGYTCTVASTADELKKFSEHFILKDDTVTLKNSGSYTCNMGKNIQFTWQVDVHTPVYPHSK